MMLLRMGCERLSPTAGLSELRGNQVRDEAEDLVTRFTEMVRSRQTDIDNASEELVEEAVRIIESEWDRLQRFVDGTDVPVWWIVWNEWTIRSHNPKPLSWMTSPFRDPPNYEGHVVDGLPSLRELWMRSTEIRGRIQFHHHARRPLDESHGAWEYLGKRRDTVHDKWYFTLE